MSLSFLFWVGYGIDQSSPQIGACEIEHLVAAAIQDRPAAASVATS
jgi:hypothetical protein